MPLPFQRRGGAQLRPTFSRDFAGLKTLDHGVGPAITFTRASNATFFDASGVLQTATNDVPRFDHSGGSSLGLLIEEARTNSIRNSQAGGSTNGVIGSGGALPTNWQNGGGLTSNGISLEVVGSGSESGLSYIDFKISGTPTASAAGSIRFETTNVVAATNGQSWTLSHFVKLQSGSLSNVAVSTAVQGYDNTNNFISGQQTSINITPTSSGLMTQRRSVSHTYSNASVAFAFAFVSVTYTSGNPIDLTLRIAAPQLEQGAFPTSYIPTTTAAATRSADSAVVTPISSFYNQSEGTLFAEFSRPQVNNSGQVIFVRNAANVNRHTTISTSSTNGAQRFIARDSAEQIIAQLTVNSNTANTVYKAAAGFGNDDFAYSQNGAAVLTDTAGTIDTGYDRVDIGSFGSAQQLNGHIRKIAYYPRRLSNTLLQQLTT